MSWVPLAPPARISGKFGRAPVALSVSKAGRIVQRCYLTVQPHMLPLDWWRNGAAVTVDVGQGEHAGRVRVRSGGLLRIMGVTGKMAAAGKPNAPSLQIAGLSGLPANGLKRQAVAWEVLGDALVVNLPWSGAVGAVKAEAATMPERVPPMPSQIVAAAPVPPPSAPLLPPTTVRAATAPPGLLPQGAEETQAVRRPVLASYGEIERWAIAHNVGSATHGFDLAAVNQKRIRAGERPFVIQKTKAHATTPASSRP